MENKKELGITTNNYTVYVHVSPSKKVYVGITGIKPEYRWDNGRGYKKQVFYNAIQKYGWNNIQHIIVAENLSLDEANALERELISKYNSTNPLFGYNVDNGGNNLGSKSEDHKRKIRESNLPSKQKLSKKVLCVETNIIYDSIRDASRKTGANRNCISWCCNNVPRHKTTSGYHWEFVYN
jgi:hypothetical protein